MKKHKVVGIHQPNFFPWLGYFHKIHKSHIFIIMDNVQYQRTSAGTVSNRIKIIINRETRWTTMPIVRNFQGTKNYNEIKISNKVPWRKKMLKTIDYQYKKAPYYGTVFPILSDLINYSSDNLVEYNLFVITQLMDILKLDSSKIIRGSTLNITGDATGLLISMVKAVQGTAYLAGSGAKKYQEDQLFDNAGLGLIYQNYKHPVYEQFNTKEFIPGLSIIDVLLNCGIDGTINLIKGQIDNKGREYER